MFKKILLTFFLLIFPFFTYAETGDILSGTGLDNNSFSSKDLFSETGVTENAFSGKIEDIFDTSFNIIFQNPSYILDKDLTKEEYICDEKKDECKVNFKLVTPAGKKLSSKLSCEIDFGFDSDQSLKCNPNTVVFPVGNNKVFFKVSQKDKLENFTLKNILIRNQSNQQNSGSGTLVEEETGSGTLDEESNTGSGALVEEETGSGETIEEENSGSGTLVELTVPEVFIEVQSGLEYSGSGELWTCKKEDCKVNLTAEDIFTGSFEESKYQCLWSFSGGTYNTGTTQKCNPGYVSYGLGEYKIELKVFEKGNPQNFKENYIFVENIKIEDEEEETGSGGVDEENTGSGTLDEEETGSGETIEEENSGSGILLTIPEVFIEVYGVFRDEHTVAEPHKNVILDTFLIDYENTK
ncbi:hypothetical protein CSA08_00150 [Candidatus Gracilibacteria bacterium]|nr:MAG: hypothetical protein CSA08_00150 [Candidatus Gracilibacteria bacterium]